MKVAVEILFFRIEERRRESAVDFKFREREVVRSAFVTKEGEGGASNVVRYSCICLSILLTFELNGS